MIGYSRVLLSVFVSPGTGSTVTLQRRLGRERDALRSRVNRDGLRLARAMTSIVCSLRDARLLADDEAAPSTWVSWLSPEFSTSDLEDEVVA